MICGIIGDIYGAAGSVIAKYRPRTYRMHLKTMEGLLRNNMSCPLPTYSKGNILGLMLSSSHDKDKSAEMD